MAFHLFAFFSYCKYFFMKSTNSILSFNQVNNVENVGKEFIPQIQPWIDENELRHITEVVQSTYITEHKKTEEFLSMIKSYTGAKYAIAMGNGTLALIACLIAEDIGPGDEVIVPNLTFIATANAVKLVGATPVFCDVNRETGCIDVDNFKDLITEKTKCIIPVHLYGQVSPIENIMEYARKRGLLVVEDAAESFGIFSKGHHTGTLADYGMFSFFANKTITCGEGGVVFTDSEERYKKLFRVKNHGRDRKGIFVHEAIGYNFCFTDLQAAIGVSQMEKMDRIMERKNEIYEHYVKAFADQPNIRIMETPSHITSNHWFVNVALRNPELTSQKLKEANIGSRRFFYPLNRQPCFAGDLENKNRAYPNTEWLFDHGLSLPSSVIITDAELQYISDTIIRIENSIQ